MMRTNQSMHLCQRGLTLLLVLVIALTMSTGSAYAQRQTTMDKMTVEGGGGRASSGQFRLHGTIGQADAVKLTGGTFTVNGGFWVPIGPLEPTGNLFDFSLRLPSLIATTDEAE